MGAGASPRSRKESSSGPDFQIDIAKLSPKPIEIQSQKDPRIIGSGGFGVVYAARYGKRRVAVKIPLGEEGPLKTECLLLKDLKHHNLPEIIGSSVDPLCLVMELPERSNLHTMLLDVKQPDMEWIQRLWIALEIAQCLRYLHSRPTPLIHSDLKPSNIMVRADGSIVLMDFGISKKKVNEDAGTQDEGTLQWVAPEVLNDEEETVAMPVYGLGLILYVLLTRQEPFHELPKHDVYLAIKKSQKPLIPSEDSCSSMAECPEGYKELMKECWHQKAKRRPRLLEVIDRLSEMILKEMWKKVDHKSRMKVWANVHQKLFLQLNIPQVIVNIILAYTGGQEWVCACTLTNSVKLPHCTRCAAPRPLTSLFSVSDLTILQERATSGDPTAQHRLGLYCEYGLRGVPKDPAMAFHWYKLSSEQGHPDGLAGVSNFYVYSDQVKQDITQGLRFLQLAVDRKSARGYYYFGYRSETGQFLEKDAKKAAEYYRLSAEQGDYIARNHLGACYYHGQGVFQDYQESFRLRQLSAAQGFPDAQFDLGIFYRDGKVVTLDYQEAYRLFKLAATQGHAGGQYEVGLCYHYGIGVKVDIAESLYWYKLAAEQRQKYAEKAIAILQGAE